MTLVFVQDMIAKAKAWQTSKAEAEAAGTAKEAAQALIKAYVFEVPDNVWDIKPRDYASGNAILDQSSGELQVALVIACIDQINRVGGYRCDSLLNALLARNLPWTALDLERVVAMVSGAGVHDVLSSRWPTFVRQVRRFQDAGNDLTPTLRDALRAKHDRLATVQSADARKARSALAELLGAEATSTMPDPGEVWADRALADLTSLPDAEQTVWRQLFGHLQTADGGKPTRDWQQKAAARIAAVGSGFVPFTVRWMEAVTTPPVISQTHTYGQHTYTSHTSGGSDKNISLLKGLAWTCAARTEPEVARALAKMTEGCLKKIPGIGPWAVRAASAGVWALTEMPSDESVSALARLKQRVTYRATLNQVERALEEVAKRRGVTKDDLEDLTVPTFGLDPDGKRREEFGEYAVELALAPDSGDVTLSYFGPGGKPLKSAPAALKTSEHAETWKALKADADAAAKTLTARKQRIDGFALADRSWPYAVWRERFIDHPLLAHIARRLIWRVTDGERTVDALPAGTDSGALVGIDGQPVEPLPDTAEVRLWHPIRSSVDDVLRWRALLEERQIRQPFKQAHREVYLLTDAELQTRTYSNRFAGHIIKQHQFNQLAALRGWKNQLRLMVDDSYEPATLLLPRYNLRVEFWIEGIGDNYGTDTTDAGTYLYLTTDQVRFYPLDARKNYGHAGGGGYGPSLWQGAEGRILDPLPLTEIPPLVLSEVMRDVDLFVGVASVGNDPAWADGRLEGRHHDYWEHYSFGELSATAQTRRVVLEKLLPRLKIRDRATLEGRFLKVRGDLRTYKIHLGSGNILMEPNDQYLCIVESRGAATKEAQSGGGLFLPFEGDQRLSLILSKAFLLADDTKIADKSIVSQIKFRG
jgi:hypothetical protein